MESKNVICLSEQDKWTNAFTSEEFKQAKKKAKEFDQKLTHISNEILHCERNISSTLFFPNIFINKWQFDKECGWVPSDQIHWPKAIALSPFVVIYHLLAAPGIVYDHISKFLAKRTLQKTLEEQKQISDPRLVFGKLGKLMKHPEELKVASEQGLAPQEFVDFLTSNLETYNQLKSLPSGKPWKGQSDADPQLVKKRRVGLAPIRERFHQLQKEIYRIYTENKIQKLTKEILLQNRGQNEAAREQAIGILRQKHEKIAPTYYLFAHTPKEYKSYNMLKTLNELSAAKAPRAAADESCIVPG